MSQIDTVSAACRVLLKYLINCLQSVPSDLNQNSAQIEIYLNAVRVLCIGTSPLSTAEVTVLIDTMKGENLPQHTNTSASGIKSLSSQFMTLQHITHSDYIQKNLYILFKMYIIQIDF